MKDAMIVIAKFNQLQNQKLFALLDGLTDDQRKADVKTGYPFGPSTVPGPYGGAPWP